MTSSSNRFSGILLVLLLLASGALAQPIQPADAGAHPLHDRMAVIDTELGTLGQRLRSSNASEEQKASMRIRFDALAAEKQKIQAELKDVEIHKNSPLVQFHAPDPGTK